MSGPIITFVTVCKNRTQHLKQTLPRNLADNPTAKFVLLDYGSQDDLNDFVLADLGDAIHVGQLVVYHHHYEGPFRMAHAKNMAHRCAILEGADILVTQDADNYTGSNFAQFIADKFLETGIVPGIFLCPNFPLIHSLPWGPESDRPTRGYAGRLALGAQDFIKAGGYNETFNVWGSEDIDMLNRLQRMGYTMRHIDNCYLKNIPHNSYIRFKEYPEAEQYETKQHLKVLAARTETVVNYGKIGLGTVYRNSDSTPIEITPIPTRVFGIGMHKTGTSSLHRAFQILGLSSFHWGTGEAPLIWQEMNSLGRSTTLEKWYALSDLPIPLLYQKLDQAYPGSKFILSIRNEVTWLDSVRRLWDPKYNPTRWMWDVYPFSNLIHNVLYGQKWFDPIVFLERYRRHNAEVKAYFQSRSEDLLIFDIDVPHGWKELCEFLGKPIPEAPYPLENERKVPVRIVAEVPKPIENPPAPILFGSGSTGGCMTTKRRRRKHHHHHRPVPPSQPNTPPAMPIPITPIVAPTPKPVKPEHVESESPPPMFENAVSEVPKTKWGKLVDWGKGFIRRQ